MKAAEYFPSPPLGAEAERVGVRWGIPEPRRPAHLTFPSLRDGPLPLPRQAGGEGQMSPLPQ
jgi:hypothetical protein